MPIVETTVDQLRAGDLIVDESGRCVKITGIANKPPGKRRLIIEHSRSLTYKLTDKIDRVVEED